MIVFIIFLICILGLLSSLLLYKKFYLPDAEKSVTMDNKIALLKDSIDSYFRWQAHPFVSLSVPVALLLLFGEYKMFGLFSWQGLLAFYAGLIVSAGIVYLASRISVGAQARTVTQTVEKSIFNNAYNGPAITGLLVISLTLVGMVLIYIFTDIRNLAFYIIGFCYTAIFAQINGSIFAKSLEISTTIVKNDHSGMKKADSRNPSVWGELAGNCTVQIGGKLSAVMISYLFAMLGIFIIILTAENNNRLLGKLLSYPSMLYGLGILAVLLGVFYTLKARVSVPVRRIILGIYLTILFISILVLVLNIIFPLPGHSLIKIFNNLLIFLSVLLGLFGAAAVGFVAEYYGSSAYPPVRNIAEKSQFGPVNNILGGITNGMKSMFFPLITIGVLSYLAFILSGYFSIGIAAVGMLSVSGIVIIGHVFSANIHNSRLFYSMESANDLRYKELEDVGNTTHAIFTGYSNIVSIFSSLILLIAVGQLFVTDFSVRIDHAAAFFMLGAFAPYFCIYYVIKGINETSVRVAEQSSNQLRNIPYLLEGKTTPDVKSLVKTAVKSAQRYSLVPVVLTLIFPFVIGFAFDKQQLFIYLLGLVITGMFIAMLLSNTGGLLHHVRKFIEAGNYGGTGTPTHATAIIGDMIGAPLKDAIAPTIDILIKITLIVCLICYPLF